MFVTDTPEQSMRRLAFWHAGPFTVHWNIRKLLTLFGIETRFQLFHVTIDFKTDCESEPNLVSVKCFDHGTKSKDFSFSFSSSTFWISE